MSQGDVSQARRRAAHLRQHDQPHQKRQHPVGDPSTTRMARADHGSRGLNRRPRPAPKRRRVMEGPARRSPRSRSNHTMGSRTTGRRGQPWRSGLRPGGPSDDDPPGILPNSYLLAVTWHTQTSDAFRASLVAPARTILPWFSLSCPTGIATSCLPIPRNPPPR